MTSERVCPNALDLLDYVEGQLPHIEAEQVADHLTDCPSCTWQVSNLPGSVGAHPGSHRESTETLRVPVDIKQLSVGAAGRFRALLRGTTAPRPRPGQIWTTAPRLDGSESSTEDDSIIGRMVVIIASGEESRGGEPSGVLASPISVETAYRGSFDLLVAAADSALGYEFMIEVWNELSLDEVQLDRCIATLDQPIRVQLALLYRAFLGEDADLDAIADRLGPAITHEDDSRVAFQEREIEACGHLRRAALALAVAPAAEDVVETLGDLVAMHSNEFGQVLPPSVLAELQSDPTPLANLQGEGQNPILAAAMDRAALAGPPRRAFWTKIRQFLSELVFERQPGGTLVYARRQRGRRAR